MKKIVTIVGARPQFVKAAVVSRAISQEMNLHEILVHTGQHYDDNMSKIFFDELEIHQIDRQLNVGSGLQGKQTSDMLTSIESILIEEKPDYLLIYGDTNSTLSGALAAAKLHIPIAHIEAGLRSFNRKMPEEVNRIVADQLSDILFTPSAQAVLNLQNEGFAKERIVAVGDVMYDSALFYGEKAKKHSNILSKLKKDTKQYILATIHRAENTDHPDRLIVIFNALLKLTTTMPVIIPLHPRTRKVLETVYPEVLVNPGINLIEPLGFLDMIMLETHAALIVTDSGGIQKEAFFFGIPCVTLRDETEWVETIDLKWNKCVKPLNADTVHDEVLKSLGTTGITNQQPYGDGNASKYIAKHLSTGA
jgi:UDP-GlcNAc3NAcA epimerase